MGGGGTLCLLLRWGYPVFAVVEVALNGRQVDGGEAVMLRRDADFMRHVSF